MGNTNSRNLFNEFLQSSYSRKFRPAKYKRHTVLTRDGGSKLDILTGDGMDNSMDHNLKSMESTDTLETAESTQNSEDPQHP